MKKISKGEKSNIDGVVLTEKEYNDFKKLKQFILELKSFKKDYNQTYKSYYL